MSSAWHRLAENRINEAIERGEFSDVPSDQTLDLSEYFAAPAEDRMAMSLLRSADGRPAEVDLQTLRVTLALTLERRHRVAG